MKMMMMMMVMMLTTMMSRTPNKRKVLEKKSKRKFIGLKWRVQNINCLRKRRNDQYEEKEVFKYKFHKNLLIKYS